MAGYGAETLATLYTTPPDVVYRSDRDEQGRLDSSTPIEFVLTNLATGLRKSITQHAKHFRSEGHDEEESVSEACKRHTWVEIVYFNGETPERFVQSAIPSTSPWPAPEVDMALDGVGIRVYLRRTSLMISSAHAKRPFRVAFVVTLGDKCTTLLSKPFRVLEKRAKSASTESKGQNLEPPVAVPSTRMSMLRRVRVAYSMLSNVALSSHNAHAATATLAANPGTAAPRRGRKRRVGEDVPSDPALAAAHASLMAAGATLSDNLALNMPAGDIPDTEAAVMASMVSSVFAAGGDKRQRVEGGAEGGRAGVGGGIPVASLPSLMGMFPAYSAGMGQVPVYMPTAPHAALTPEMAAAVAAMPSAVGTGEGGSTAPAAQPNLALLPQISSNSVGFFVPSVQGRPDSLHLAGFSWPAQGASLPLASVAAVEHAAPAAAYSATQASGGGGPGAARK